MEWLTDLSYVFGAAFLVNGVPHFVSGLMGRAFQSPFAKPPGVGLSSSTVNVLWGLINFAISYFLMCRVGDFDPREPQHVVATGLGALVMALVLARIFGKVNGGATPGA